MLAFKALDIEDSELFRGYSENNSFNTYDHSFTTLYQWRKLINTEICVIDDILVVKEYTKETGAYFLQPISLKPADIDSIIKELYDYKQNNPDFKYLFGEVDSTFLNQLLAKYGDKVTYAEDSGNFDYIYNSMDLLTLSGKKYHRKKNLYNQFIKSYKYEIEDIREEQARHDCIEFAHFWYDNNSNKGDLLKYELEGIDNIFNNIEYFNIAGLAVYIDNKAAGFAFGEKLNDHMAVVHCEKGDINYSGIYSFLNRALVQAYFSNVSFINRQEDMGLESLRRAKMAYHPAKLERKYFVNIAGL